MPNHGLIRLLQIWITKEDSKKQNSAGCVPLYNHGQKSLRLIHVESTPEINMQYSVCRAARPLLKYCKWEKGVSSSEIRFVSHLLSMIVAMDIRKQKIYGIEGPHQNFK